MTDPTPPAPPTSEIRKALDEATPGPWEEHGMEIIRRNAAPAVPWHTVVSECEEKSTGAGVVRAADAHLIANAPTWLAQLLDEVDALTAKLAAAEARIEQLTQVLTIARDVLALRAAESGDTIRAVSVCDHALREATHD